MPTNEIIKKEFKDNLYRIYNFGFDRWAVYTQAFLETGNFSDGLSPYYNFFGLKAHADWMGDSVEFKTKEFVDGKEITIIDKFMKLPDAYTALTYYDHKIKTMYPNAYAVRGNYQSYFRELVSGNNADGYKWATDPSYADKLINLYADLDKRGEFVVTG